MSGFKIGNVEIKNQVILAPMAGITSTTYRRICKKMGAGLVVAEMVSDKALIYESKKTYDLLKMYEDERPISQQVFGGDSETMGRAAKIIEDYMHPDIIDINMGCPVPKVAVRAQAGSALLKDPDKIYEIVKAVVEAVPIPVTVKIRSGWDSNNINAVEVAKTIEKAGASAICVHPRTRSQGYSGKADWSVIKAVKDNVSIPVIGNGDVKTPEDVIKMISETGCDAVMIGRGILGNPWLIKNAINVLEGKPVEEVYPIDRVNMCLKHLENLKDVKNEKTACLEIRNHIGWYFKGMKDANVIKNKVYQTSNIRDIISILNEFKEGLNG